MMRAIAIVASAAVAFTLACRSESDMHLAMYSDGGASPVNGVSGSRSHVPTVHRAGAAGLDEDGGAAGSAGDPGAASGGLQEGMIVDVPPSACAAAATWTAPAPVSGVSTAAEERLLSVTPDELDIAFARGDALFRAHRESVADMFDSGTAVALPNGYSPNAGVAFSADGSSLVIVQSDGQGFAELKRASRSGDFVTEADGAPYKSLNDRALQTMEHYAAPVLSSDGKRLVFAGFTPSVAKARAVVYESLWSRDHFTTPISISDSIFDGTSEARVLPSGLSSDARTLFYYDEASSKERLRFRDRPDAPLYTVVELSGRNGAAPNGKCDHIYYSSNGNVLFEAN